MPFETMQTEHVSRSQQHNSFLPKHLVSFCTTKCNLDRKLNNNPTPIVKNTKMQLGDINWTQNGGNRAADEGSLPGSLFHDVGPPHVEVVDQLAKRKCSQL